MQISYLFIVFGEHGRYIGNINHLWWWASFSLTRFVCVGVGPRYMITVSRFVLSQGRPPCGLLSCWKLNTLGVQWTLFITAFVITAKFVITSIRSAQKSADHELFHWQSNVIPWENIRFGYLLESPCRGDSNKYTKRMICKRTVQNYPLFML